MLSNNMSILASDIAIEIKVEISNEAKERLLSDTEEQGQVIVHCKLEDDFGGTYARIWPTTYLIDTSSNHQSRLLYGEGITIYPVWTEVPAGTTLSFTLIFSPLPKSCVAFDLFEQIPESGGFHVRDIKRNSTDVYHVDLTE